MDSSIKISNDGHKILTDLYSMGLLETMYFKILVHQRHWSTDRAPWIDVISLEHMLDGNYYKHRNCV